MAKYNVIDTGDLRDFNDFIDRECGGFSGKRVVASNAYYDTEACCTMYYALIEDPGPFDLDSKILSELESINSNTSNL